MNPPERPISTINGRHNAAFNTAKRVKNDEFYTQYSSVENELKHYKKHFKNKIVYLNCDDPRSSNFYNYFLRNFKSLELKKLITTCYKNQQTDLFSQYPPEKPVFVEYDGTVEPSLKTLSGDGDFRSSECIDFLKKSDIVVTNPPFSLFREYVDQLLQYEKKFLIIGNLWAFSYKDIFPLFKAGKLQQGFTARISGMEFVVPDDYPNKVTRIDKDGTRYSKLGMTRWFTNMEYPYTYKNLILTKYYTPEKYSIYDNYDAINVNKCTDIPIDYTGNMGVPFSFIDYYNPQSFEIIGMDDRNNTSGLQTKTYTRADSRNYSDMNCGTVLKTTEGYKKVFSRIFIRHRNVTTSRKNL